MTKIISKRGRQATVSSKYTGEEIKEICLCGADPAYFINKYVMIQLSGKSGLLLQVLPLAKHHIEYIETIRTSKNVIAMLPRDSGTTTRTMAYLLWEAMFNPSQRILAHAANIACAKTMCDILQTMFSNLPLFLQLPLRVHSRTSIAFNNGSSINVAVASPGALTGVTFSRLFIDNFAFIQPLIQKDLWMAFAPSLAFNGRVLLASTPNGTGNTFHNIWEDTFNPLSCFTPFKRTVDDLPYTSAWKTNTRVHISEAVWKRDFMCEFV